MKEIKGEVKKLNFGEGLEGLRTGINSLIMLQGWSRKMERECKQVVSQFIGELQQDRVVKALIQSEKIERLTVT